MMTVYKNRYKYIGKEIRKTTKIKKDTEKEKFRNQSFVPNAIKVL